MYIYIYTYMYLSLSLYIYIYIYINREVIPGWLGPAASAVSIQAKTR